MLTIVTPTKNRPQFLRPQFEYYQAMGYPYDILIVDVSDEERMDQNLKLIDEFKSLKITHFKAPVIDDPRYRARFFPELLAGLREVKTKYSCLLCDDDFNVLSSLKKCVDQLEAHPDTALTCGLAFTLTTSKESEKLNTQFHTFPQPLLLSNDPLDRVQRLMENYGCTTHGVHRNDVFIRSVELIDDFNMYPMVLEMLQVCLVAVYGKIDRLPDWHFVTHNHQMRTGYQAPERDFESFLFSEDFHPMVTSFKRAIFTALSEVGDFDEEVAHQKINDGFTTYMITHPLRRHLSIFKKPPPDPERHQEFFAELGQGRHQEFEHMSRSILKQLDITPKPPS